MSCPQCMSASGLCESCEKAYMKPREATDSLSKMKRIRVQQGKPMYSTNDEKFMAEVEDLAEHGGSLKYTVDARRLLAMVRERDADIASLRVAVVDVGMKDSEIARLRAENDNLRGLKRIELSTQNSGVTTCMRGGHPFISTPVICPYCENVRLRKMVKVSRETLEYYGNRCFYKRAYDEHGQTVGCTVDEGANARSRLAELNRLENEK